jgi:hypothetical protein
MGDNEAAAPAEKSRFLPAVVAFLVVAAAVFLAGTLATWVLRKIVLPVLAVILGWIAAKVVYKLRD